METNNEVLSRLIIDATQGDEWSASFTITERAIITRMMEEYFTPDRAWSKYGTEGWWMMWEAIKGILDLCRGVPGVKASDEVEIDMLDAVNATTAKDECKEKILPWVNSSRNHYEEEHRATHMGCPFAAQVAKAMFDGNEERITWRVMQRLSTITAILTAHGIPFTFTECEGVVFQAPGIYVDHVQTDLISHGMEDLCIQQLT